MIGRHLFHGVVGALAAACGAAEHAAAQRYVFRLQPEEEGPPVMAAIDPGATLGVDPGPPNPYIYECVAFLQVRDVDDRLYQLRSTGALAWRRDVVWIEPAGDASRKRHPRLIALLGPGGEIRNTLGITLAPENAGLEYVVRVDSAEVIRGTTVDTVRDLVSEPFSVPREDLAECGRVPDIDVGILAPEGEGTGFGVSVDATWRRGLRVAGGGLIAFEGQGAFNTGGGSALLNAVSAGARIELKLTKGWRRWVSVGVGEWIEATERLDVVDLALGASVRARLDFLPLRELAPLLRRFTPYPMLTLEYRLIDRVHGEGEVEVAGRPAGEHRFQAALDWTVPMILRTTVHAKLRADYLLSDVPAGQERLRTLYDVKVAYPLSGLGDATVLVQWLEGRAPPAYELASLWLTGLGIRF